MSNYIVDGADLTSVADAIRTKGGTSAQLAFPAGFVSAIGNISGGWVKTLTAVFTQADTRVFTTDELDDLRDSLVVTATYQDDTSETVTDYDLSGTLVAGTSTIVVTYGDKSTTFTATVTEAVDITPALTSWLSKSGQQMVVNQSDKSILLYRTANGAYNNIYNDMTFEEGYGYRFSADVEYYAGAGKIGFAAGDTLYVSSSIALESMHLVADGVLSDDSRFQADGSIRMYCTWSTSTLGRVVYRNIKLIKYSTATPADALNLLMGGESA